MSRLTKLALKVGPYLTAIALSIGVSSATSACYFWFNQPKMPESIERFRN